MAKMKTRFLDIAKRITGLSVPIFGVSWNPPTPHIDVSRRLITFLEDRRVLYVPYDREEIEYAVESVLQVRERLTEELEQLDRSSELARSLADMRAACRRFLDKVQDVDPRRAVRGFHRWDVDAMAFFAALGELRAVFGIHIAQMCVMYGIDVEDQLEVILPPLPDEDS